MRAASARRLPSSIKRMTTCAARQRRRPLGAQDRRLGGKDVLPVVPKRSEDYPNGQTKFHGAGGERVSRGKTAVFGLGNPRRVARGGPTRAVYPKIAEFNSRRNSAHATSRWISGRGVCGGAAPKALMRPVAEAIEMDACARSARRGVLLDARDGRSTRPA